MGLLNKRDVFISLVLFTFTFLSRIFLVELYQSHWDGPQYSIAVVRYSFEDHTPSPPGYPLYIGIAYLFNTILRDPHYSLLLESVLFSAIGAVIMFFFGKALKDVKAGIASASIYIFSPVIYYFGLTAYAYGINGVTNLLFAYLLFVKIFQKQGSAMLIGLSYGFIIGIRPQELLTSWPLLMTGLVMVGTSDRIKIVISSIIFTFAWLVPFSVFVGGLKKYLDIVWPFGNGKIPPVSLQTALYSAHIIGKGFIMTIGAFLLIPVIYFAKNLRYTMRIGRVNYKKVIFFGSWIMPSFLFNSFIRSDHAGYQLTYLMPIMLVFGFLYATLFKSKNLFYATLLLLTFANLFMFFYNRDPDFVKKYEPTSFHYSEIRKNDIKVGSKISWIRDNVNPRTGIVVIGEPDYFRPVTYYLPEYRVLQIDRLVTEDINYVDLLRFGSEFKMQEVRISASTYRIPDSINQVICFDDECVKWLRNNSEIVMLPANSFLTIIETRKGLLKYAFGSLEVY